MTVTDQIKILNKKILQNEAQYDLDKKAAIISAWSSKNLDKVEYLTGEDLGLRPDTIEQAKFEHSSLGKIFNKGLDKDDQKEVLFKRLKNIKNAQKNLIRKDDNDESIYYTPKSEFEDKDDKDKKQQTNNIDTKPLNVFDYLKNLSEDASDLMDEMVDKNIDIYKLVFIGSKKKNLTLTLLKCHYIFSQLFIIVKFH